MATPDDQPRAGTPASHTSVIYVHGIGSQRRYEETSRVIDSIDTFLTHQKAANVPQGLLRRIDPKIEPLRGNAGGIITYIETTLIEPNLIETTLIEPSLTETSDRHPPKVRFYEVYWAPVMAEQKSPWRIVKWMFAQVLRPYRTLMTPWRERQRLRRAALVGLLERRTKAGQPVVTADYETLLARYDLFESIPVQTDYPKGSFSDFVAYVGKHLEKSPDRIAPCQTLAKDWLSSYRGTELTNAAALVTVALTLLMLGFAAPWAIQTVLGWLKGTDWLNELMTQAGISTNWSGAASLAVALAGILGVGKVLSDYMGDVESWATYEETDEKHVARNKVMQQAIEVMEHVLNDDGCARVAIVSHSLGTSIAHDALLSLMRRNRARAAGQDVMTHPVPVEKIEHFITMGSPIDKIEYFFESYASASHRYKRVVERLRGDIGTEPFSKNGKPHIHWINFWDQGDLISGSLQSPAGPQPGLNRVDNQHVASYHFPSTAKSHAGYFTHRAVIATIFEAVYQRKHSFRTLTLPGPQQPYDYDSVYLALDEGMGYRIWYLRAALLIPWAMLAGLIAAFFGACGLAKLCGAAALILCAGVALGYIDSARRRHRNPL